MKRTTLPPAAALPPALRRGGGALGARAALGACAMGLGWALTATAQEAAFNPDDALRQQVQALAAQAATGALKDGAGLAIPAAGQGARAPRLEVVVGQLDPRLHLAPCARIEPYLPPGQKLWGTARVGLRCTQGPKAWNVSLPVTVRVWAPVTVLAAAATAGSVLEAGQLATAEADLAAPPGTPVLRGDDLLGRTLVRNLPAGSPVRATDLQPRRWFAAGETVRVRAGGSGWQVLTEGEALGAGIEGQLVRVRTEGGRMLQGRPSGDREVEVAL